MGIINHSLWQYIILKYLSPSPNFFLSTQQSTYSITPFANINIHPHFQKKKKINTTVNLLIFSRCHYDYVYYFFLPWLGFGLGTGTRELQLEPWATKAVAQILNFKLSKVWKYFVDKDKDLLLVLSLILSLILIL